MARPAEARGSRPVARRDRNMTAPRGGGIEIELARNGGGSRGGGGGTGATGAGGGGQGFGADGGFCKGASDTVGSRGRSADSGSMASAIARTTASSRGAQSGPSFVRSREPSRAPPSSRT